MAGTQRKSLLQIAVELHGTEGKNKKYIDKALANGGGFGATAGGIEIDENGYQYIRPYNSDGSRDRTVVIDRVYNQAGNPTVTIDDANKWFDDAYKLFQSMNSYAESNKDIYNRDYGSSYSSQIADMMASATGVEDYLYSHRSEIGNYDELYGALKEYREALKQYDVSSASIRDYYSQWESEDQYNYWSEGNNMWQSNQQAGVSGKEWAINATSNYEKATEELTALQSKYKALEAHYSGSAQVYVDGIYMGVDNSRQAENAAALEALKQEIEAAKQRQLEAQKELTFASAYRYAEYADRPDFDRKSAEGLAAFEAEQPARGIINTSMFVDTTMPGAGFAVVQDQLRNDTTYKEPSEEWTEEQKKLWGYLKATDAEEADTYAIQLNDAYATEKGTAKDEKIADWSTKNAFNGALATAGSILATPFHGVEYLADVMEYNARGVITEKSYVGAADFSNTVTGAIAERLNTNYGTLDDGLAIVGGKGWGDAYQLATSIIQSTATVAAAGPWGSSAIFFGTAAKSGLDDALNRGATPEQALLVGFTQGVAEVALEHFSIEGMLKLLKKGASKTIIIDLLKQGGIEASEEMFTSIANNITDGLIMGENSNLNNTINRYMTEEGMSYEEAQKKAYLEQIEAVAFDAIGGFVSGLGSGAIMSGAGSVVNNVTSYQGDSEALLNTAKNSGNEELMKLAEEMAGRRMTNARATSLLEGMTSADVQTIAKAAEGQLKELGENGDISLLSSAIAKTAVNTAEQQQGAEMSQSLTKAEKAALKNSKYGQRILNELNAENILSGEYRSGWTGSLDTTRINPELYGRDKTIAKIKEELAPKSDIQTPAERTLVASEEGKTTRKDSNEEVKIKRIASIKDGAMTLELEDGSTVDSKDILYESDGEALVYETVARMNINAAAATTLVQKYNPSMSAEVYSRGIQEAYRYGMYNIPVKEMMERGSFSKDLNEEQRNTAYSLGRIFKEGKVETQTKAVDKAYEKAKEALKNGGKKHKLGKVNFRDNIKEKSLTKQQKTVVDVARVLSSALGVDINFYSGMKEYGRYVKGTGTIWLNVNANVSGQTLMLSTLSHELVHFGSEWSPAKFQAFADFLFKHYGKDGMSVEEAILAKQKEYAEQGIELTEEEAYEELIAEAASTMLTDSNAVEVLAELNKDHPDIVQKIKDFLQDLLKRIQEYFGQLPADSPEAQRVREMEQETQKILQNLFTEMLVDAGEHYSTIRQAFGKNTVIETNADGEFLLAKNDGKGNKKTDILFNAATWERGGRDTLATALRNEGFSAADVKAALTIMDAKYELVKQLGKEYSEQDRINKIDITTDIKDGHSVISALVTNGDYPVNIDLMMVCKKRQAYQKVINRLCETGMIQQATVDSLAIAEINKILGKYGFETACLGCFVESRRLRIQEWAETITKEWNAEVKKRNPNAKPFAFGRSETKLTQAEIMQLVGELESGGEKNDKGNLNLGQGSAVKRMGVLLDKVPSLQKTLSVEDLITPDGLKRLRQFDSNLFSMVKSRYGSNSPKYVQDFNPYNSELAIYGKVPSQYESLREYLYAIGGARMQSFSDFIVENWFDYCQIVADLAARKLPMHTYTKEIALVKLFGMTGIKVNMSLIPDIDHSLGKEYAGLTLNEDGEYELIWADKDRHKATGGKSFMQSINFADAIALQEDPRYSANVGTIAVGVSDNHILKMLDDPRIRMIIPYHSSGMNPIYAHIVGSSYYKDYTNFQNTTVAYLMDSKGNRRSVKLSKPQVAKLTAGFEFNQKLQELGDARATAEAYKEWCKDASQHTITINGETYTAVLTPKFNDFADHNNYYKLLEDFNTYDCITEEAAPQGDVTQTYPEDFEDLLKAEVQAREEYRQKQDPKFNDAMAEIEGFLKDHSKANTVHYADKQGINLSAKDRKLNASEKAKLSELKAKDKSMYRMPAYQEWDVQAALYDALDHGNSRHDNVIKIGRLPNYISNLLGVEGDMYIYRDHAYENMVSKEQAIKDGRPIRRNGKDIHFHDHGIEKMTDAIMSLEHPIMTIASIGSRDGNPAAVMLLDEVGKNGAPLYAAFGFYTNEEINGSFQRRPHIVLTIAERDMKKATPEEGRDSYEEFVRKAVDNGKVIDFDKEKRDVLSVIAEHARLGNITDTTLTQNLSQFLKEIKAFKEKNGINYRQGSEDSLNTRHLLANALETVAQNDIERNKIQQYKEKIDLVNAEERKLQELRAEIKELSFAKGPRDTERIKSLQFEAIQAANRINTIDRQLLRLEASKPLQAVLEREKAMAKKRAEQKGKEALEAYREKAAKTQRELLERVQQSRKNAKEGRDKTAMRHKIKDIVTELNNYLLKGTKDKHVMIGLQKAVAAALDAVNMDTVGAEERIAKLNEELIKAKTPEKIMEITRRIERVQAMGDKMSERLAKLKAAYADIKDSDDPLIANSHDEVIEAKIEAVMKLAGETPLRNMSLEQLEEVYELYKMVLTRVRDSNKAFKDAKKRSIDMLASNTQMEVEDVGGRKKHLKIFDGVSRFLWNNFKPIYAFKAIGSKTLGGLFDNVRAGEDVWAKDVSEARVFFLEQSKKHGYDSWDMKKTYTFTSITGMDFKLNLEQIMSLYAYSKRKQAEDHLQYGGIVFEDSFEKKKLFGKFEINLKTEDATAYNISPETMNEIIAILESVPGAKTFVDAMQDYLSATMGEKGNEVSLEMYGVKLFKEKFYFPLKSSTAYMARAREQAQGEVKIKNSGFTKETNPHAKNPIVLESFLDVWANHVNDMSMYHAFTLPLEDFYRVFNYKTPNTDPKLPAEGVIPAIQNAYGKAATSYIDQMLRDLNGGARSDPTAGFINKMMGLFKKGAVFASASVVIQQPSAIARAMAIVDSKYFAGRKLDSKRHKALWEEVKQYAPIAIIKEMGYFDTNVGKSTVDFIKAKEYDSWGEKMKGLVADGGYRDEVLSKAPALADELAWCAIWEAVKRETAAKHKGLEVGSEAFLKAAGERFTEVIVNTQVYDSVLSRSANMRSKDTGMKMATAFLAEPTTSINMIADALIQGKRGNRKYARAAIGAVIASQILNAILVSFVYAGRDDDEDETYWEKYLASVTAEIKDSFNLFSYIPFVKDIVSIVQGYDVERSDIAVISDLWKAYQQLGSDKLSAWRKVENFAGSIAQLFGLPVKNIMRDARGLYQTVKSFMGGNRTTAAGVGYAIKGAVTGKDVSDRQQLYEAMMSGDTAHAERVKARFEDQAAVDSAIRKALRENDPRIHEAAVARYNGDIAEYTRIAKEIIAEGHFSQDYVVTAINTEMNTLKPDSEASSSKSVGLYTDDDYFNAVVAGDTAAAEVVREGLIAADVAKGDLESTAQDSLESSFVTNVKASYLEGNLTAANVSTLLTKYGDMDADKAKSKIAEWDFEAEYGYSWSNRDNAYRLGEVSQEQLIQATMKVKDVDRETATNDVRYLDFQLKYPQYSDLTSEQYKGYYAAVDSLDVSPADVQMDVGTYAEYRIKRSSFVGVDEDGDGKTDSGSVKVQVLAYINSLPLTSQQKDVLYFMNGWSARTINEAPWH